MNLWDELDEISAELERRGVFRLAEEVRSEASTITSSPRVVLKEDFGNVKQGAVGHVISKSRGYYKVSFGSHVVVGIHEQYLDLGR
jgi:hypothetical protein